MLQNAVISIFSNVLGSDFRDTSLYYKACLDGYQALLCIFRMCRRLTGDMLIVGWKVKAGPPAYLTQHC